MPPKTPLKTPWLALRAANKKAAHAGDNLEFFSEMATLYEKVRTYFATECQKLDFRRVAPDPTRRTAAQNCYEWCDGYFLQIYTLYAKILFSTPLEYIAAAVILTKWFSR